MSNILTGVKSGNLHIGNYISTIKPIIESYNKENNYYIMVADAHALTVQPNPEILKLNTQKLYLTLFATLGDLPNVYIYRQSQIPEIFKLYWYLSCFTSKGLLNRNHTYKTLTQENINKKKDPDKGIFMGIFSYSLLMSADIFLLNIDQVPIGKDQEQHLEQSIDIGEKMNYFYNTELFKMPNYTMKENIVLNSYDGKKMSKSYNNVIPLICHKEELREYIFKFKTNNKMEGEQKEVGDTELSNIIYNVCSSDKIMIYNNALADGVSWKGIKELSVELLEIELKKFRDRYFMYLNTIETTNKILLKHEEEVRSTASKNLKRIEQVIGF